MTTKAEKERKVRMGERSVSFDEKEVAQNKKAIAQNKSTISKLRTKNKNLPVGSGQRSLNASAIKNWTQTMEQEKKMLSRNMASLKKSKEQLKKARAMKISK